ncbi:EexN family lipoprotein [Paraburkholderia largidicola]|uniref:Lipoprotein n=1 Tax=Paraburkholderia largidicola TaxID=3014751 RepID=A0A7I8C2G4_9BURK|nr:EexN family lipoprotein [Paraburkholderia sp. PGU16]BCF95033.1 hypothetical protein PPGU16_81000 [Paraburkholderia sp. PGU16]
MNKIAAFLFVALLSSCGNSERIDTVESLVANPDRLREVEQKCASDAKALSAECNAASEARHQLFVGNGPQYTPSKSTPRF